MDLLDGLMAIGGLAFILLSGGIYLLFSSGVVELPSATGDGFMEALTPGLEEAGYTISDIRDARGARVIVMEDDQAGFVLACRKDPTKTMLNGNESRVYEGEVIEGSTFGVEKGNLLLSTFYKDGYLCFIGSRSGRARSGVSEIKNVISEFGTVIED